MTQTPPCIPLLARWTIHSVAMTIHILPTKFVQLFLELESFSPTRLRSGGLVRAAGSSRGGYRLAAGSTTTEPLARSLYKICTAKSICCKFTTLAATMLFTQPSLQSLFQVVMRYVTELTASIHTGLYCLLM
jgi:hypothetical protein